MPGRLPPSPGQWTPWCYQAALGGGLVIDRNRRRCAQVVPADPATAGRLSLSPDIVLTKVPFHQPFLLRRKIDEVRAGRSVMAGNRVFPIRFARADRFKEMAEVRQSRLRPFILEMLD